MDSAAVTRSYTQLLVAQRQAQCSGIRLVPVQSQRWVERPYLFLAGGGA